MGGAIFTGVYVTEEATIRKKSLTIRMLTDAFADVGLDCTKSNFAQDLNMVGMFQDHAKA